MKNNIQLSRSLFISINQDMQNTYYINNTVYSTCKYVYKNPNRIQFSKVPIRRNVL